MVDMFIRCGYQELKFIRNSGAILGFAFGLIQVARRAPRPLPW
jgi:hypothetical protein